MDLQLTGHDLDITNGDLALVSGADAIRQDVEMRLRTWLAETSFDRAAGVPYLQVIFRRGVTPESVRFIIERQILAVAGITEVVSLETSLNVATRAITITGSARSNADVIDFETGTTP